MALPVRPGFRNSVLLRIAALTMVLCAVTLGFSVLHLAAGWRGYRTAAALTDIQQITDAMADGLRDFMFERGRMNVVLSAENPISDENRDFILQRRTAADQSFQEGLRLLDTFQPEMAEELRRAYRDIGGLRTTADREAELPPDRRDPAFRSQWFNSCNSFIEQTGTTLADISHGVAGHTDIFHYHQVVLNILNFRSIAGYEASLFASRVSGRETLDRDDYAALLQMRGKSGQIWARITEEVRAVGSDSLTAAAGHVEQEYYETFRSAQDVLLEQMLDGTEPTSEWDAILTLSVPALDSVFLLADEALRGMRAANETQLNASFLRFLLGLGQILLSVALLTLVPVYTRRRLARPVRRILSALHTLSEDRTDILLPETGRRDEIGQLARGVGLLRESRLKEQALREELRRQSVRDELTGLYNRRHMMEMLEAAAQRHRRSGAPFSVIMADIDRFKSVNDTYGHHCGDTALRAVSGYLSGACREQDTLARWGGEEFLLLLPETGSEGAVHLAERIRIGLKDLPLSCGEETLALTMTFGVAEYDPETGIDDAVNRADTALLLGKRLGRNRVQPAGEGPAGSCPD